MTAAWGADPVLLAGREAHMALREQQFLDRTIADLTAATQRPLFEPPAAGLSFLHRQDDASAFPAPIYPGSDPDTNNDGIISFEESLVASPPAAWGARTMTLGFTPPGGVISTPPASNLFKQGQSFNSIQDPVEIVQESGWPVGMEHWNLAQRLAWLRMITKPYMWSPWAKDRLAQATGMLYQQYGPQLGKPF